jgi:DNA-binding MarR family transcriptional regulator
MPATSKETANELLEVVPAVMRTVRSKMRESGARNLSVPQFRALGFIARNQRTSLSDVAEHIGLTLPSMSKLVDGLVERKLVLRANHPADRRRIMLELTGRGRTLWQSAREATQASLAERLSALSESECAAIMRAMRILHPLFTHKRPSDSRCIRSESKS